MPKIRGSKQPEGEIMEQAEQIDLDNQDLIDEESAPQAEEQNIEESEQQETQNQDGVQKRINKITADKWVEKDRADKLQAELDKIKGSQNNVATSEPQIEDFDFDDAKFNSALIDYKVDAKIQAMEKSRESLSSQDEARKTAEAFNLKVAEFSQDKTDVSEVLQRVPTLQPAVLSAIMNDGKSVDIAYYLGKHLDFADKVSQMNPISAAIEIGKLSEKFNAVKSIKSSSAPEPIEPMSSGGATTKDRGPAGATFE